MSQSPINSGIQGFLGYLGLKQQGQNVSALADQVVPTIDIDPFYEIGSEQVVSNIYASPAGVLDQLVATIPQGKAWAVTKIGAFFLNPTNDLQTTIYQRITYGPVPASFPLAQQQVTAFNVTYAYNMIVATSCGAVFPKPMLLKGGSEIRVVNWCPLTNVQSWTFGMTYKEFDL